MRSILTVSTLIFLLSAIVVSQDLSREQKIRQITDLNAQVKTLEDDLLLPAATDLKQAKSEGFDVFRLMPREVYAKKLTVSGGGCYYSFTFKSNDYQQTAQISLAGGELRVGFGGADYGFVADLGDTPIGDVTLDSKVISFLVNYRPPIILSEIRREQRRAYSYETESGNFSDHKKALVGHTYALRSINFDRSDILVAFRIVRTDTDESLIIFWKLLQTFDKPTILRDITEY